MPHSSPQQPLFALIEVVYSEKSNAPTLGDGCELCEHCFDLRRQFAQQQSGRELLQSTNKKEKKT